MTSMHWSPLCRPPARSTVTAEGRLLIHRPAPELPSRGQVRNDDLETHNAFDVTNVGGRDAPATCNRGRCDEAVMGTDSLARRGGFGPQARVRASAQEIEWHGRKCQEYSLDKRLSAGSMSSTGTVRPAQELGRRDGGDTDVLVASGR